LAAGGREVTEPEGITIPEVNDPAAAATASSKPRATSETAATSASNEADVAATSKPAVAATRTTMAAASTTAAAMTTTATTASAAGQLYGIANIFPIEEMERGETDVLHFLFAKNEALIGRDIVRLQDISSGHRGSRCTTEQRKT
jgi:hypothetical protein